MIANDVTVGAGAVVVKDIENEGVTVAGVPAKEISKTNSHRLVFWFNNGKPVSDIGVDENNEGGSTKI